MHFNSNENKINNWEAVYKKLVIKVIMELAGKLDLGDGRRGHRWDEGGYVPLRDKIRGVRRGSPDWTVAGRIYMEDRPREVSDWVRRGDLGVAKDRIFVTQLGIRRGRKGPYKGDERERERERANEILRKWDNYVKGCYWEGLGVCNLKQGLMSMQFL